MQQQLTIIKIILRKKITDQLNPTKTKKLLAKDKVSETESSVVTVSQITLVLMVYKN